MSLSLKTIALRPIHYAAKVIFPLLPVSIPELISGPGSIARISEVVKSSRSDRILIVTDKGLISTGLLEKSLSLLQPKTYYTRFLMVCNQILPSKILKTDLNSISRTIATES